MWSYRQRGIWDSRRRSSETLPERCSVPPKGERLAIPAIDCCNPGTRRESVNGQQHGGRLAVDAVLPGGAIVRVRVAESAGDAIGSVGLGEKLRLDEALATIGEVAALVRDKLETVVPTKATVEFGVSFAMQGGKLMSLVFDGKADASLTVTLEWDRTPLGTPTTGS